METPRVRHRYYVVVHHPGGGQAVMADMSPEPFETWLESIQAQLDEGSTTLWDSDSLRTRIEPGPGMTFAFMTESQFRQLARAQQAMQQQAADAHQGHIITPR